MAARVESIPLPQSGGESNDGLASGGLYEGGSQQETPHANEKGVTGGNPLDVLVELIGIEPTTS